MNIKLICFLVLFTIGTKTKHLKADKIIKAISCGRGDLYTKGEDGIQYDNVNILVNLGPRTCFRGIDERGLSF